MIFNLSAGGFSAHLSDAQVTMTADSTKLTFSTVNHVPDLMIIVSDVGVGAGVSSQKYVVSGLLSTYDSTNITNWVNNSQFGGDSGDLSAALNNGQLEISVSNSLKFRGNSTGNVYAYHLYYTDIG